MSLYVLDTDMLSLAEHGHARVRSNLLSHAPSHVIAVTIISIEEQWNGWQTKLRNARTVQQAANASQRLTDMLVFLKPFSYLPQLESAIRRFETLKKLKLGVGAMDLRIAAMHSKAKASL